MKTYKELKEQARDEAINWQHENCDKCLYMSEYAMAGSHFMTLAKRYGLIKEFRENGII